MRVLRLLFVLLAACSGGAVVAQQSGTWRNAEPGRALRLPADHASHPEYRIEWWYYTGNLTSTDGRRFGYQLTFFRIGVDPSPANPSRWAVRDLFMGHLAVTDVGRGRHRAVERLSRPGGGGGCTRRRVSRVDRRLACGVAERPAPADRRVSLACVRDRPVARGRQTPGVPRQPRLQPEGVGAR
jgi:hypothetical protein